MNFFYHAAPLNLSAAANMEEDLDLIRLSKIKKMPVLRIYRFQKPAVTFGRAQKIGDVVDIKKCEKLNIEMVKRPTGGRAFFHYDDFTYAIAGSNKDLFNGTVEESYKKVSAVFLKAFLKAGLSADFIEQKQTSKTNFCFSSHIKYEIQEKGKKIMGSSQIRAKDYSMQHGSLNFNMDYDIAFKIFRSAFLKKDFISFFKKNAGSLSELGINTNFSELKEIVLEEFKKA